MIHAIFATALAAAIIWLACGVHLYYTERRLIKKRQAEIKAIQAALDKRDRKK